MTLKSLSVALALCLLPALPAVAGPDCGMTRAEDRQAMSCLPGTDWDPKSATCAPVTMS